MAKQLSMLRRRAAAAREATSAVDNSVQERQPTSSHALAGGPEEIHWRDFIASLNDEERAGYQREVDRIEAAWANEFQAGALTPLAYYRRLRRLPLDYLAFHTGIDLPTLFRLDDGVERPSPEQAELLAKCLEIEPFRLI